MLEDMITILKYEYHISPGQYFEVDTPWVKDISEVKTIIIDQDNVFTKMVNIYPGGFVMFLEQFPTHSIYRTNYPLELKENSDVYHIVFDKTIQSETLKG
ncbi:hypothetical protein SAMN05421767_10569 [Granulicatella balaenopterae]|uniref:Uncharacterized protein n=1 Tax=Granulicatella balaenopterae TaxID=137733 RepID=A0A1H9IEV6_9LACT|nr:hypothetical protein [Granulicatella balaenopterae]SEQ73271.1 hypothetical protein SAMN05421767_10569 [Granulicatella balaenopterae]